MFLVYFQLPLVNASVSCVCFEYLMNLVYSSCLYFLWADIQLSKGKVNNYETKVTIDGKDVSVMYRSAPCSGVKECSENGCPYVAAVMEHRSCHNHPSKPLYKTNDWEPYPV